MIAFFKLQWKTSWLSACVWSLIMGVLSYVIVLSFPSFQKQGEELTKALQNISFLKNLKEVTDMQTLDGFVNGQWLLMLPFVLSFFAILFTNQIYTREIDTRSIEFTLSLPVSRMSIIFSRFLVFILQTAFIHLVIFIGLWIGKIMIDKSGSLYAYFLILCNDTLLLMAIGSLTLFISLFFSDYTKSLVINIGLMIVLYFEDMIAKAIDLSNRWWNLFYWYKNDRMMDDHQFPFSSLVFEVVFTFCFLLLSFFLAKKRDV